MGKESRSEHRANTATLRGARIAPRKARVVIDLIRQKPVGKALNILEFTNKRAAPMIQKLVESALFNVEESDELDWDIDNLVVDECYVNEGPTMRRFKPRAMGRATRINKRTSHITVVLQPKS